MHYHTCVQVKSPDTQLVVKHKIINWTDFSFTEKESTRGPNVEVNWD